MQKKSIFTQLLILIVIGVVCVVLTTAIALLFGSVDSTIFDWRNLNVANMIPVLLVGGFLSCVVIGITILVVFKNSFLKAKEFLFETKNEGDNNK